MNEEARQLLAKAERSISAASTLLQTGNTDFAASRVYYAMFYTGEALLAARGLSFSKHTGLHEASESTSPRRGCLMQSTTAGCWRPLPRGS